MVITLPVAEWASSRSRLVGASWRMLLSRAKQPRRQQGPRRGARGRGRPLQGLPGHFQEEALLRVEAGRLAGDMPKKWASKASRG